MKMFSIFFNPAFFLRKVRRNRKKIKIVEKLYEMLL